MDESAAHVKKTEERLKLLHQMDELINDECRSDEMDPRWKPLWPQLMRDKERQPENPRKLPGTSFIDELPICWNICDIQGLFVEIIDSICDRLDTDLCTDMYISL